EQTRRAEPLSDLCGRQVKQKIDGRTDWSDADRNHDGISLVQDQATSKRKGDMIREKAALDFPESRRKEIFHLLVVAQDNAMGVAETRQMACALFGLAETQVVRIEQEGLDSNWPPL